MKLVSINIEGDLHFETVFEFIKQEQPNVVCVQELLEKDFEMFKEKLVMQAVYQPFLFWNTLTYPDWAGKKGGVAIFAKNIIASGSVFYEGRKENVLKSFDEYLDDETKQKNKAFVWADVGGRDGEVYRFTTTHPPVTIGGESTPYQLEVFDKMITELEKLGEFILCGDMNAPRGNESFTRLANKYKDNIPLEYKTSIDQNLHKAKGLQLMVDGLFTTPTYKASNVRLVDGVSDHMAIVAEIDR